MSDSPQPTSVQHMDLIQAFKQDVRVSLDRSVERDDRSTLALAVLARYLTMMSQAMLRQVKTAEDRQLLSQLHTLPSLFFETAQLVGTHHDYDKDKIREANARMIDLFDIGMRLSIDLKQQMRTTEV